MVVPSKEGLRLIGSCFIQSKFCMPHFCMDRPDLGWAISISNSRVPFGAAIQAAPGKAVAKTNLPPG